jgi:hypothetical protein
MLALLILTLGLGGLSIAKWLDGQSPKVETQAVLPAPGAAPEAAKAPAQVSEPPEIAEGGEENNSSLDREPAAEAPVPPSASTSTPSLLATAPIDEVPSPPPPRPTLLPAPASPPPYKDGVKEKVQLDEPKSEEPVPENDESAFPPAATPISIAPEGLRSDPSRYGFFEFSPSFSYARINSSDLVTGGDGVFLSKLMPAFEFGWGQQWSDSFSTRFNLGVQEESFYSADERSLENATHSRTNFGFSAQYSPRVAPELTFDFGISLQQEDVIRATSLTALEMDTVAVPEFTLGGSYQFLDLAPFSARARADVILLAPAGAGDDSLKTGFGYNVGMQLTQELSPSWALSGSFDYSARSQDSASSVNSRTDIGVTFQLKLRLR